MVPKKIFFTKGVGKHKERLTSFELALRDAGIASQNLVRVSSIFPPQCKVIPRKEGLKYLNHGEVVFSVIAENSTREPHRLIVSSIGVAIPADRNTYGYLSEHHSFGETEDQAGEYAEELAAEMLATTLDVDFDPDTSWDEKKEIYRISNKIVRTSNITQSAVGDKRGLVRFLDKFLVPVAGVFVAGDELVPLLDRGLAELVGKGERCRLRILHGRDVNDLRGRTWFCWRCQLDQPVRACPKSVRPFRVPECVR